MKRKPDPTEFDIRSVPKRVEKKGDLFKALLDNRQTLAQAVKRLEKIVKASHD